LTTFLKIMKKIVLITAILSSFTIISQAQKTKTTADASASQTSGESFTVTLKTPSYKSGLTYLCYHMGKNLNIEDSTYINQQGIAIFKGDRKLMGGIYAIVFPGKNLTFDFFVDKEQNLSIFADSTDLQNVKIIYLILKSVMLHIRYDVYVGTYLPPELLLHHIFLITMQCLLLEWLCCNLHTQF